MPTYSLAADNNLAMQTDTEAATKRGRSHWCGICHGSATQRSHGLAAGEPPGERSWNRLMEQFL